MRYTIWHFIRELSEAFRIPLGRFAPWVFGKMIGSKPIKKKE